MVYQVNQQNTMATKSTNTTRSGKKVNRKNTAKRSISYETVQSNIQKITTPSGNVSYRVRVGQNGEVLSEYTTSLRKAQQARKAMLA